MLRYALTQEGDMVSIDEARSSQLFFCPDCLVPVGKKMGPQRAWHFYHFESVKSLSSCKRQGDCTFHTRLVEYLVHALKDQGICSYVEYPVLAARRIADIAIVSEKIALEVQRTPISLRALVERTQAYICQGWQVIWFLSSTLWKQSRMPHQLERLGTIPYYIFEEKEKDIFVFDEFFSGKKVFHRPLLTIRPIARTCKGYVGTKTISNYTKRLSSWNVHLQDDFIDSPPRECCPCVKTSWYKRLKLYLSFMWLRCIS